MSLLSVKEVSFGYDRTILEKLVLMCPMENLFLY